MWNIETGEQLPISSGTQLPISDLSDWGQRRDVQCVLSDTYSAEGVNNGDNSEVRIVSTRPPHTVQGIIPLEHRYVVLVHAISADIFLAASSPCKDGTGMISWFLYNMKSGKKVEMGSMLPGLASRAMILGLPGGRFALAIGSGGEGSIDMYEVVRNEKGSHELRQQDLDVEAVRMSKGSPVGYYGKFQSSLFWLSRMLKPTMAIAPDNQPVEIWTQMGGECAGCKKAIQDLTTDAK